jgi:hypothetical protein
MPGEPEWGIREFTILLENPSLSNEELAEMLPARNANAVSWVRGGVHEYHMGKDHGILSKLLKDRLRIAGAQYECPSCGVRLG